MLNNMTVKNIRKENRAMSCSYHSTLFTEVTCLGWERREDLGHVHTYRNDPPPPSSLASFQYLHPNGSIVNDSSRFSSYSRPIGGTWNSPETEKKSRSMHIKCFHVDGPLAKRRCQVSDLEITCQISGSPLKSRFPVQSKPVITYLITIKSGGLIDLDSGEIH